MLRYTLSRTRIPRGSGCGAVESPESGGRVCIRSWGSGPLLQFSSLLSPDLAKVGNQIHTLSTPRSIHHGLVQAEDHCPGRCHHVSCPFDLAAVSTPKRIGYVGIMCGSSCVLTLDLFSVTILFFLWGFGYGLLDTLNSHFQTTLNITASRSSGLQASYFAAYFICPLTISGWIVRRYGFRVTFMTGKGLSGAMWRNDG